ncbi:MAG: hypothetical protein NTY46_11660 [Candidatus Sumerlaeota bacterium]|nr:hypothetical protein [Candidatus Sumerlaeota bacterium]
MLMCRWGAGMARNPATPRRKRNGERWPELATPQADRQRKAANQAMGLLFK